MDELLQILCDIVTAEYAQWMRYTYLSSLSFGLNTDSLKFQFEEHAIDELVHAKRINRWIVDLGDLPPTEIPCVEQFYGSTEDAIKWILEAEISGIRKYNYAYELASALCIPGLQSDIGWILEKEHEHTSEMFNLVTPHMVSEDQITMVMVANKFRRLGQRHPDLLNDILYIKFNRKEADINYDINTYLRDAIELGMYNVVSNYDVTDEEVIGQLQNELPELVRTWIVEDVENDVRGLWSRRDDPGVVDTIRFYKDLYEWITSSDVASRWNNIMEAYRPDWQQWLLTDWYQEGADKVESEPEVTMEDIFQQIQETGGEPTEVQDQQTEQQELYEEEQVRRPIEPGVEKTLTIRDPNTKKKTLEVGIGDQVFNQTAKDILKQNEEYGLTSSQAREYATGIIRDIDLENDSVHVEIPNAPEPFNDQIWSVEDRLWGSREEGERIVN